MRELYFTVTENGISPAGPQFAGIQGEHPGRQGGLFAAVILAGGRLPHTHRMS